LEFGYLPWGDIAKKPSSVSAQEVGPIAHAQKCINFLNTINMKLFILLILSFTVSISISSAQMIVDNQGQVGVGSYWENNTNVGGSTALHVSGSLYVTGDASKGVTIESYSGDVILRGGYNNGGYLGKFNDRWGNIYTNKINGVLYTTSDMSIKENIKPIENAILNLMKINPVEYDIRASFFADSAEGDPEKLAAESKNTAGVIAQELIELYPQLVKFDKDANLYEVNYVGLIPHLIKALQEQQLVIEDLIAKVETLENAE